MEKTGGTSRWCASSMQAPSATMEGPMASFHATPQASRVFFVWVETTAQTSHRVRSLESRQSRQQNVPQRSHGDSEGLPGWRWQAGGSNQASSRSTRGGDNGPRGKVPQRGQAALARAEVLGLDERAKVACPLWLPLPAGCLPASSRTRAASRSPP